MTGGAWDRVAGYIANGANNLELYGTVAFYSADGTPYMGYGFRAVLCPK